MRSRWLTTTFLVLAGCSGAAPEAPPTGLPFEYTRPEVGEPVTATEIALATDKVRDLLEDFGYFGLVADRVHGWPREDPEGRYWYGTWWSGVQIVREGGQITFLHSADGADNNGLRTAPLLEAACYEFARAPTPEVQALLHAMVRGFSSWIRAMERTSAPGAPVLLARAAYPESVAWTRPDGLEVRIDYSLNRPGEDNGATEYVHLPDNPDWGDLWVKNKRSKDDIGYMFKALLALDACEDALDPEVRAEVEDTVARYEAWAREVVANDYGIPTYDKDLQVYVPRESLALFVQLANAECDALLSMRLMGHSDEGTWDCGNGITDADALAATLNGHNRRIFISFHEALAHLMVRRGDPARAKRIVGGLARRSDDTFAKLEAGELEDFNHADFAGELLNAAGAGVPLTWREVRYLHARIDEAHAAAFDPAQEAARRAFAADGVDGTYGLELRNAGFNFRELGLLLSVCSSRRVNPASKPVIDCAAL